MPKIQVKNVRQTMNAIADATSSQASEAEQTSFDMDELALSIEEIHKEIELMNGYVGQSQSSNVHNSEMMFHVFESWGDRTAKPSRISGKHERHE